MKVFIVSFFALLIQLANGAAPPYGQLSVSGTNIKGNGQTVQLRGMSLFWSQWYPQFYNQATVQALKCQWNSNVVRAAMAVNQGGYLTDASGQTALVNAVVQAAIDLGIYVIIDWHIEGDNSGNQAQAITFFQQMATKWGSNPNIIYEVWNEPTSQSWSGVVKPYATAVIKAIRAIDSKNLIIVGTPTWSQDVDVASQDPITGYSNIAYTLHFYAASHFVSGLGAKAQTAINNGIALFVTEYGTVSSSGDGGVDSSSMNDWWTFLDQKGISYLNWAVDDKAEGSAALNPGTTASQVGNSGVTTASGTLVKNKLVSQSNGVSCSGTPAPVATTKAPVATTKAAAGATTKAPAATTKAAAGATTKAPAATTKAASGSGGKVTGSASLTSTHTGGQQIALVFTNADTKAVCSVTFKVNVASGQTISQSWNMDATSTAGVYTLATWANIPASGGTFNNDGMIIDGPNNVLPTVTVQSYGYC